MGLRVDGGGVDGLEEGVSVGSTVGAGVPEVGERVGCTGVGVIVWEGMCVGEIVTEMVGEFERDGSGVEGRRVGTGMDGVLVGLGLFDPSGAGVRTAKGIFVMRITGAKVAYSGIKQTREECHFNSPQWLELLALRQRHSI